MFLSFSSSLLCHFVIHFPISSPPLYFAAFLSCLLPVSFLSAFIYLLTFPRILHSSLRSLSLSYLSGPLINVIVCLDPLLRPPSFRSAPFFIHNLLFLSGILSSFVVVVVVLLILLPFLLFFLLLFLHRLLLPLYVELLRKFAVFHRFCCCCSGFPLRFECTVVIVLLCCCNFCVLRTTFSPFDGRFRRPHIKDCILRADGSERTTIRMHRRSHSSSSSSSFSSSSSYRSSFPSSLYDCGQRARRRRRCRSASSTAPQCVDSCTATAADQSPQRLDLFTR